MTDEQELRSNLLEADAKTMRHIKADLKSMKERGVDPVLQFELIEKFLDGAFFHGMEFQMANLHVRLFPDCKEAKENLARLSNH